MGDSTFQSQTQPPAIAYATEDVQPPAALAVTTNDQLVVDVIAGAANIPVDIFARLLLPDSTIAPMQFRINSGTAHTLQTAAFPMAAGFLLTLVISTAIGNIQRGQVYVRVRVFRGSTLQAFAGIQLLAGYMTTLTPLAWPDGIQCYSHEGWGNPTEVFPSNPGAGAELAVVAPSNVIWHLNSFEFQLVTSAVVANRFPTIQLQDNSGNLLYEATVQAAIPASQTKRIVISAAPYAGGSGGPILNIPWPDYLPIQQLSTVTTFTTGLQGGDVYSQGVLYVDEFLQT